MAKNTVKTLLRNLVTETKTLIEHIQSNESNDNILRNIKSISDCKFKKSETITPIIKGIKSINEDNKENNNNIDLEKTKERVDGILKYKEAVENLTQNKVKEEDASRVFLGTQGNLLNKDRIELITTELSGVNKKRYETFVKNFLQIKNDIRDSENNLGIILQEVKNSIRNFSAEDQEQYTTVTKKNEELKEILQARCNRNNSIRSEDNIVLIESIFLAFKNAGKDKEFLEWFKNSEKKLGEKDAIESHAEIMSLLSDETSDGYKNTLDNIKVFYDKDGIIKATEEIKKISNFIENYNGNELKEALNKDYPSLMSETDKKQKEDQEKKKKYDDKLKGATDESTTETVTKTPSMRPGKYALYFTLGLGMIIFPGAGIIAALVKLGGICICLFSGLSSMLEPTKYNTEKTTKTPKGGADTTKNKENEITKEKKVGEEELGKIEYHSNEKLNNGNSNNENGIKVNYIDGNKLNGGEESKKEEGIEDSDLEESFDDDTKKALNDTKEAFMNNKQDGKKKGQIDDDALSNKNSDRSME